jgi:hypothetical protein
VVSSRLSKVSIWNDRKASPDRTYQGRIGTLGLSPFGVWQKRPAKVSGLARTDFAFHDGRVIRATGWFPQVLVFAVWLLFLAAALSASTTTHSKFVGTYLSDPRDGAKPGPSMDVSLGSDGTATVTEDPGNGMTTLFGHWADSGSLVKVTFDAVEGKPAEPPMVFEAGHDGLHAVTWNHATWGKTNPPPMKNKAKVKERLTHNKAMD